MRARSKTLLFVKLMFTITLAVLSVSRYSLLPLIVGILTRNAEHSIIKSMVIRC